MQERPHAKVKHHPRPKVSVVIPVFNASDTLPSSVESILKQSYTDFELILIDDGSSDDSWALITEYSRIDPRVIALQNEVNLGISRTRNKGLSFARGEFLMWQDADDISLPDRMEKQCEYLDHHPREGMVGGSLEVFSNQTVRGIRRYPTEDVEIRKMIFRFSPIAQPAAMIRMSALKAVGDYNIHLKAAEDLEMTFRIGELFELANIPDVVLRYRLSSTSATYKHLRAMEKATISMRLKYARSERYSANLLDISFNLLHFISIWLIPPRLKLWLFDLIRNKD